MSSLIEDKITKIRELVSQTLQIAHSIEFEVENHSNYHRASLAAMQLRELSKDLRYITRIVQHHQDNAFQMQEELHSSLFQSKI